MVAIASIASLTSFGQATQVVNKTTTVKTTTNPVKLTYEKDQFSGKEYLICESSLMASNDGKKGFFLYPSLAKKDGKWVYNTLSGKAAQIGNCYENETLYILFEDGTKKELNSWRDFNCKGDIGFDLYGKELNNLAKPIKGVKLVNGRTYDSFEYMFTKSEDRNFFINFIKALDEFNSKN